MQQARLLIPQCLSSHIHTGRAPPPPPSWPTPTPAPSPPPPHPPNLPHTNSLGRAHNAKSSRKWCPRMQWSAHATNTESSFLTPTQHTHAAEDAPALRERTHRLSAHLRTHEPSCKRSGRQPQQPHHAARTTQASERGEPPLRGPAPQHTARAACLAGAGRPALALAQRAHEALHRLRVRVGDAHAGGVHPAVAAPCAV
jgi:hypothetical protein